MTDSEGENVISSSVAVFSAGDFPQAAIIHSTKSTWWPLIKQNTFNNLNKRLSLHLLLSHNRKELVKCHIGLITCIQILEEVFNE